MRRGTGKSILAGHGGGQFLLGPPRDSEELLQLFSLLLERADAEVREGKPFGIPFASLMKLAHCHAPSAKDLRDLSTGAKLENPHSRGDWPRCFQRPPDSVKCIVLPLMQYALDTAVLFNLDGAEVCRALAAVGQTLEAQNREYRRANRTLADRHRNAARRRIAVVHVQQVEEQMPDTPAKESAGHRAGELSPVSGQILVTQVPPWQMEFRRADEQAACLRLSGLVLWHASYIGPRLAGKTENQDATCAMTTDAMASPPSLVFALADGVTTSLGSRFAATTIVRRFCELGLQRLGSGERVTGSDLVEAARQTQASLNELLATLLKEGDFRALASMLGSEITGRVALRILENTIEPRVAAMPAALTATLIGGVVQPGESPGSFQVELIRIGDGSVERINASGKAVSVLDTDPDDLAIAEALGPGPQSRALFERDEALSTERVLIARGEALLISSDGLARGHHQLISDKLAELLGERFWSAPKPEQADAALHILHRVCEAADHLSLQDPEQGLFADNVSLIVIRSEE